MMILKRIALIVALVGCLALLAGFASGPSLSEDARADRVVVDKSARSLLLFDGDRLLKRYSVSLGFAPEGAKQREGDGRTPEGHYFIDWRNPNSCCHLSLHISYPDARDLERAEAAGVPPGGDIMIHGLRNTMGWRMRLLGRFHTLFDWTSGCIAVTDREMDEIWRAVPNGTPIEIRA